MTREDGEGDVVKAYDPNYSEFPHKHSFRMVTGTGEFGAGIYAYFHLSERTCTGRLCRDKCGCVACRARFNTWFDRYKKGRDGSVRP